MILVLYDDIDGFIAILHRLELKLFSVQSLGPSTDIL